MTRTAVVRVNYIFSFIFKMTSIWIRLDGGQKIGDCNWIMIDCQSHQMIGPLLITQPCRQFLWCVVPLVMSSVAETLSDPFWRESPCYRFLCRPERHCSVAAGEPVWRRWHRRFFVRLVWYSAQNEGTLCWDCSWDGLYAPLVRSKAVNGPFFDYGFKDKSDELKECFVV